MLETIKSYLVSLGFAVDQSSYNEATKSIDKAGDHVAKFAGGAVKNLAMAGAAVTSFAAAAVVGIAKFLDGLGQASIKNEMLARQMWITEQNAMAFNSTLKAMGVSLQDLYLSPTLMSQFQQLRKEANNLQAPAEYKNEIQLIQSISFEFKRMKLEATYALQWIGYYFIKYMSGPILQIKLTLSEINDVIVKKMPSWTKVVAQVMSWFAQFGITTVRAIKDVGRVFDDLGSGIPKNIKLIGGALAALGLIIETGPLGILIAIFTVAILLLNDFYTYLDGGESAFGPFWKKLMSMTSGISDTIDNVKKSIAGFLDDLGKNGTLDNLQKNFTNTFDIIKTVIDGAKTWVQDLFSELSKQGVLADLKQSFEDILSAVTNLDATVSGLIDKLLGLDGTKTTLTDIGKLLNDVIITALKTISGLMEGIAGYVNVFSGILNGNTLDQAKKAGDSASKRLAAQPSENKGYWHDLWQTTKEMFTDNPFTGGTNFRDKITRAVGNYSNLFSGGSNAGYTPSVPSYLFPFSNKPNNNSNKINLTQTNNIYGSDPKSTADAAQNNMESMYMRNMKGLIQ